MLGQPHHPQGRKGGGGSPDNRLGRAIAERCAEKTGRGAGAYQQKVGGEQRAAPSASVGPNRKGYRQQASETCPGQEGAHLCLREPQPRPGERKGGGWLCLSETLDEPDQPHGQGQGPILRVEAAGGEEGLEDGLQTLTMSRANMVAQRPMQDASLFLQLAIAFGGGVLSFLSPCVLPLVPGYLSMMSGYSVAAMEEGQVSNRRMLAVVGLFISGFTVVFAAFGATASSLGRFLSANLPLASRIAGGVVLVFGLIMVALAISERGLLQPLSRDYRPQVRPSKLGAFAPPVMGAAFAFGWTPCIGPILTVVLATAATRETLGQGVALLVAYSLGLGLPFLLSALGMHRLFKKIRPHLKTINIASGALLAVFGLVMVTGNLNRLSSAVTNFITRIPILENLASI